MLIENNIEDGIDFFHMDALSSAVAMKVNCDLQLTLMASSLYRLLAVRVGNGYETAKSRHLFRDFVDASASIEITERRPRSAIPEARTQPAADCRRVRQDRRRCPLAGRKAPPTHLRLTSIRGPGRGMV